MDKTIFHRTNFSALIAFLVISPIVVNGQGVESTTDVITSAFRGITKSYKKNIKAEVIDTVIDIPSIQYPAVPRQAKTIYSPDLVQPAKLKVIEPLQKLYKGYVKAGIGMYTTPLLDVYFNETRSRSNSYGFNVKHFSSQGGVKDYNFSGFQENEVHAFGKKMLLNSHAVSGYFDFENNLIHNYGILETDTSFTKEDLRQRFNLFGGGGAIKSFFKDSAKVNYMAKLGYYNFHDLRDAEELKFDYGNEHNVLLTGRANKYINKELYALDFGVDYNNFQNEIIVDSCAYCDTLPDLMTYSNVIVKIEPTISTQGKNYKFTIGLGFYPEISSEFKAHFYPVAEFKYSLFDNIIIPYAGITGRLERNSFRSLANENPFILSGVQLLNTSRKNEIYGGIRGTLSSTTSFNVKVSNSKIQSLPLFVTDTTYSNNNRFNVMYDTVTVTNFTGQLAYEKSEKLKLFARGDVYTYQTRVAPFAWNLPGYKFTVSGIYDLLDKYLVKADVFVVGGRKAASAFPVTDVNPIDGLYPVSLNNFVDFNLGFEYRYTKRLSVFLNFNNIVSKQYQIWHNYPSQKINILGGLTFSF